MRGATRADPVWVTRQALESRSITGTDIEAAPSPCEWRSRSWRGTRRRLPSFLLTTEEPVAAADRHHTDGSFILVFIWLQLTIVHIVIECIRFVLEVLHRLGLSALGQQPPVPLCGYLLNSAQIGFAVSSRADSRLHCPHRPRDESRGYDQAVAPRRKNFADVFVRSVEEIARIPTAAACEGALAWVSASSMSKILRYPLQNRAAGNALVAE